MTATALSPMAAAASLSPSGFNWGGLVVLVVLVAVAWPLWRRLRGDLSQRRRERWAREEGWEDRPHITPDNDPDLRRDPPVDPSA